MPMRYIGRSISKTEYSIFTFKDEPIKCTTTASVDTNFLINSFGTFSFNKELYSVFLHLGGFISGEDSLLYKWAEFTVAADRTGKLTVESALKKLRTAPVSERMVRNAQYAFEHLLDQQKFLSCVWTGERISSMNNLHIDHLIPFAVWKNNDLWNLIPAKSQVNLRKRDRIPSPEVIERNRENILFYWEYLRGRYRAQFDRQIAVSLLGKDQDQNGWQNLALNQLKAKCEYLIGVRGFEEWNA